LALARGKTAVPEDPGAPPKSAGKKKIKAKNRMHTAQKGGGSKSKKQPILPQ